MSPGLPSVRWQALIQTTKGATSPVRNMKKSMASPNSQARQQRVGLKIFILFFFFKFKTSMSSTYVWPNILMYCNTVSGFYDSLQWNRKEKRTWTIALLRPGNSAFHSEMNVSEKKWRWAQGPQPVMSLNVGPVIWGTGDDSLLELGFPVSERNNVSAMTKP